MTTPRLIPALLRVVALCLLPALATGQATVYSSGCSSLGQIPIISHSGTLATFQTQTVHMGGAPPGSLILLVMGITNTDANGDPLAIDISNIPDVSPGCTLNTSIEVQLFFTADQNGNVDFSFPYKPIFGPSLNFQFAYFESFSPNSIAVSPALNLSVPLTVTPDLGTVVCDSTHVGNGAAPVTLTLTNQAFKTLIIDQLTLFDGQASDFSVLPGSPLPVNLPPGASLPVQVFFSPTGEGPRQTSLRIDHANLPAAWSNPVVTLSGLGLGPAGDELQVDIGSSSPYLDSTGQLWSAEFGIATGQLLSNANPIAGTADPTLYQTYREGPNLRFSAALPNGPYELELHFAEPVFSATGQRLIDVSAEGQLLINDLDIFAQAGKDTALSQVISTQVNDGMLDLDLTGQLDSALLCALEVRSLFPVLSVAPTSHDFGFLSLGQSDSVALILSNTGTASADFTSVTFHTDAGAGADFVLDLAGVQYTGGPDLGPHTETMVPMSFSLGAGQSAPATLGFTPQTHSSYDLLLEFDGNFATAITHAVGNGGSVGDPFLHVVIEPLGQTIDWDADGSETVTLDGSLSHTHEPGHTLTSFTWTEGANTLANSAVVAVPFSLGPHTVCLTIGDDNLPMHTLTDCIDFTVSPVTAVPGVLAQYYDTGATPPANLLDGNLGAPDFAEALGEMKLTDGGTGVGGSSMAANVLGRLRSDLAVALTGSYEFSINGGVDRRLWIDGALYSGALTLPAGDHMLEARFAIDNLGDLPGEVLFGPAGGSLVPIPGTDLTHDESLDPPVINAMTGSGSTLGGNTVVIDGFGFFPPNLLTVHWGAQDLLLSDFVSWSATRILLLSPAHVAGTVNVSVETPQGISGSASFVYDNSGPPPITFNLATVANMTRPTCGTWGSDGRFYVGQRFGQITALTFDDAYNVVAQTEYPGVSGLSNFEIMGLTTNPWDAPGTVRLYVAHSQLFAQGGGPFTQFSPYPGQVSILQGPGFDTPIPLITGLPTSNHDHAINGMEFDNNGDLLICVGGNTNAGIAWPSMGDMDESPLSGAMLKAHTSRPDFNGAISYVETASGLPNNDQGDGAIVDVAPGSHVEVQAPGLRNPFDLVYTTDARLYVPDNGPNNTFGPPSLTATTQGSGDAVSPDEFILVERDRYYGHANRNRGRTDDRQNEYHGTTPPDEPGVFTQNLIEMSSSVDGIDEYRASTFASQMRGEILVQRWNSDTFRVALSSDGRSVLSSTPLIPTTSALGLATGPGGAVVLMDFSTNSIKVLTPVDSGPTGMTVYDIFPWRAPATGGTPFVIGGTGFGSLASTSVLVDGVPATITAVTPGRIEGVLPPAATLGTGFIDLIVDSGGQQSVLPSAMRWLFVPAGNEPGRWETLPDLPLALGEVSAGVINGVLYVIGEGNDNTYAYDVHAKTWSMVAPRPFPGHHTAAEVFGDKWYLFGGIGGGSPGKLQIYDPTTDIWTLGADMPWAASSSSTAVIGSLIYAAGGMVNGQFTVGDTVAYDPASDSYASLAAMPLPRNHAAAATDGARLWVFGGRGPGSGDDNTVANGFDQTQVYDPLTDSWETSDDPGTSLTPLPQARGGMGKGVFKDGEFYVFGGETLNGPGATINNVYDRVDVYDPVAGSWRSEAPMPLPRHGIFPVLFEGRVLIPGGGVQSGNSQTTGCDLFDRQ